jgi:hypothetical protein
MAYYAHHDVLINYKTNKKSAVEKTISTRAVHLNLSKILDSIDYYNFISNS